MNYIPSTYKLKLRKTLGKFLKNSEILQILINSYFLMANKKRYLELVDKRKNISLFDYKLLAGNLPFCPLEKIKDSNYYGQSFNLKKYTGLGKIDWSVEHGLMFGDYMPYSYSCKITKKIITMNDFRVKHIIEKTGKPVIAIGPYIHYCQSILDKTDIENLKKQYGSILLFFPSHSSVESKAINDIEHQIQIINDLKVRNQYKTVIVCMYYLDIIKNPKYCELYEKVGFKIVTAGHQLDYNFLNRLKSIISLADYTISSSVGTHIGYCIYLNKPHWLINEYPIVNMPNDYKLIYKTFRHFNSAITLEQKEVASKLWGFNNIKSKKELLKILQE